MTLIMIKPSSEMLEARKDTVDNTLEALIYLYKVKMLGKTPVNVN